MEDLSREIKFKAYLSSKGNNVNRKRMNFFKTIPTIKELVYRSHIRGCITMKNNHRLYFGHCIFGRLIKKYVNNEED